MSIDDVLLSGETALAADIRQRREDLVRQLAVEPDAAFTRLQYLQVAVGCANRCAFCSQQAGSDVWQVSASGLADLVAAITCVVRRRGLRLAADRLSHRPGVLFPYLDNDIGSYPHLQQLAGYCADDLEVKLRISTVGYSRRHEHLTAMHQRIVAEHGYVIDGVRFSLTPYAVGYRTHREEYLTDLTAALRMWKPYVERVGPGGHGGRRTALRPAGARRGRTPA